MSFKIGDRVVVTGDSDEFGHGFEPGTLGTVVLTFEHGEDYLIGGDIAPDDYDTYYVGTNDLRAATEEDLGEG